jgi:UDP-N-acetylglucosamine diphosphorylase / glucose-1-phosphate thymidylyltransferase / UDP-N-acetylgalactosamine diphosphorylase / glucosamine-1-phosphate N-acetyltransferase / galactosamine-1-phosphate N-acetyltransferase
MRADELFSLPPSLERFALFFPSDAPPWAWVAKIAAALDSVKWQDFPLRKDLPPGLHVEGHVYLHPTAKLPAYGVIQGPAWIGAHTEIRPGAFVRGNVIVGEKCVLGNSCEYKNCLLLDGAQTPHYNYVGDSVLGNRAHLGAGATCANLRLDKKNVPITFRGKRVDSGLRKLGALMGDDAEAGCNAVLQPGAILGKRSAVLPTIAFAGYLPPNTLAAARVEIRHLPRPE